MKKKYSFLWIDDYKNRERDLQNLIKYSKAEGTFKNVKGVDVVAMMNKILSDPKFNYDLILIDHYLDSALKTGLQIGSTVTEYIREQKPDCPIVGITSARKVIDIDFSKKNIYEDLFEVATISDNYNSILSIAEGYRLLARKRPQDNAGLVKFLKAPDDLVERLTIVIPEVIKKNYKDKSLLINVSKWIRHGLMSKPGFLYNKLWTSTLLGIKEESFIKVNYLFEKAKYNGLFADKDNPRWWQAQIRQIIHSMFPDDKTAYPWQLGHRLDKISKKDHSICHVCEKEFPETVGYTDEAANKSVPMHLQCSSIHPNFEVTLYYDDIRMMVPA